MKKIPTIFKRNLKNMKYVTEEINPWCQWVFDGEGVATKKLDGTCCRIKDGKLWRRREIGQNKPGILRVPDNFEYCEYDPITDKTVGWIPVTDCPNDKWHNEAFKLLNNPPDGTYELCGPKINGNNEDLDYHLLFNHNETTKFKLNDRTFNGIRAFLESKNIEGIVFHHPDGRMAKIKKRDFGQRRKKPKSR